MEQLLWQVVAEFTPVPEAPGVYAPSSRLSVAQLQEDAGVDDPFPSPLPDETLVGMSWSFDGPGSSSNWELNAITLADGRRVYWEWGEEGQFVLGASRAHWLDGAFLKVLLGSNGFAFDTSIVSGRPTRIYGTTTGKRLAMKLVEACTDEGEPWEGDDEDDRSDAEREVMDIIHGRHRDAR